MIFIKRLLFFDSWYYQLGRSIRFLCNVFFKSAFQIKKMFKVTSLDSRASSLKLFSDIQLLFLFIDVKFSLCSDFGRKVRNFCFILTGFGELRGSQAPSPPRREKYYAPSPHRTRARFRCRQAATISLLVFETCFNAKN